MSSTVTRRTFLIGSAIAATSAAVSVGVMSYDKQPASRAMRLLASPIQRPRAAQRLRRLPVAVARGRDYGQLVERALNAVDDNNQFDIAGKAVLIKPSLAWDRPPGLGVNVNPDVLRSVIEFALRSGAKRIVICDRTVCQPEWAYRVSGAMETLREIGDPRVNLLPLGEADFVPLQLDNPLARGLFICRHVLDAECVINLATMRQHPGRGVSLALANLLGLIGGQPATAEWLKQSNAELAMLGAAIRPDVTIIDATSVIIRNGPLGCNAQDAVQAHTVIASRDPVAVESAGLQLFGSIATPVVNGTNVPKLELPHIALAEQLGLGFSLNAPNERRMIYLHSGGVA